MSEVALGSVAGDQARALTNRIKVGLEGTYLLIQEAFASRAWEALGYETWHEYCVSEFDGGQLRLPKAERQKVVELMRETGMSTRAIGSAIGVSQMTVVNDIAATEQNYSVADSVPEPDQPEPDQPEPEPPTVTGVNGKTYQAKTERTRPRIKLTSQFESAVRDLTRLVARFERLTTDDRYRSNRDVIAELHTPEVRRAAQVLGDMLRDFTPEQENQ